MDHWIAFPLLALLFCAAVPASADEPPRVSDVGPGRNETDAYLARRRDAHDSSGVTLDVRWSILVPSGQYFNGAGVGMDTFGPGSAIALSLGFHPFRHLGILVGARGSFGHAGIDGCDTNASNASCGGYSLQVPVMIELDATDRTRGFFVQGGVGLLTSYTAYGAGGTMNFTNDFAEYKAAVGWRHPFDRGEARSSWLGLEIFVGADVGQFANADIHTDEGTAAGSIDARAWHYVFEGGVGMHFTP
jgi:hypothetical protein